MSTKDEQNAKRYRWLRSRLSNKNAKTSIEVILWKYVEYDPQVDDSCRHGEAIRMEELDSAIDAAIAAEGES